MRTSLFLTVFVGTAVDLNMLCKLADENDFPDVRACFVSVTTLASVR